MSNKSSPPADVDDEDQSPSTDHHDESESPVDHEDHDQSNQKDPKDTQPSNTTDALESEHAKLAAKAQQMAKAASGYQLKEQYYDTLMKIQNSTISSIHQEKMIERQKIVSQTQSSLALYAKEFVKPYPPHAELELDELALRQAAEKELVLVPIRLDIELEGYKLRDTFTWNLNESLISVDAFAKMLCQDLELPAHLFTSLISKSIQEQIDDFLAHAPHQLKPIETETKGNDGQVPDDRDVCELRTIIKLDITIDNQTINDQFEWDIGCKRNDPEAFAEHMVNELGLVPEFKTAIAHSIREQVQQLAKSLLLEEYPFDGSYVKDEDLLSCFLAPVQPTQLKRQHQDALAFGPSVNFTTQSEIDRIEKDLERDARRKRRQTQRSRRALAISERDSVKTNRTLIPPLFKSEIRYNIPQTRARSPMRHSGPGRPRKQKEEDGVSILTLPAPYVSPLKSWQCIHCKKSASETTLIRHGPHGDMNLCNECGIEYNRKTAMQGPGSPKKVVTLEAIESAQAGMEPQSVEPTSPDN